MTELFRGCPLFGDWGDSSPTGIDDNVYRGRCAVCAGVIAELMVDVAYSTQMDADSAPTSKVRTCTGKNTLDRMLCYKTYLETVKSQKSQPQEK